MITSLRDIRREALRALLPPPRLKLSTWLEREVRLRVSALPGPLRLWPYQCEIADAIGDPLSLIGRGEVLGAHFRKLVCDSRRGFGRYPNRVGGLSAG